jgi:surface polysaccharide O-acyltransferase-like enzyme
VAIVAVIAIHTTPFELQSSPIGRTLDLATVVNQAARFAVPFFFVLSGYFWANKFKDEREIFEPTARMAKRIAALFLVWSAIYLLPMNIIGSFSFGVIGPIKQIYWNLVNAVNSPLVTLMQGTKVHLWFLVGLLCSLFISALLLRFHFNRLIVVVAVTLYLVGLAGKAYSDTPLGFHANFNFRNGPFFSLIFFVTGYFLQRRQTRDRWFPVGCLLAILGVLLHFTELLILNENWGTTMAQDYVIGTYFFGVGMALVALSNTKWLHSSRVASIGPLVLGIYASHFIFVDLLSPLDLLYSGAATWDVLYVVAVFLLSYTLALIFSRHRLTKRLVV